jgi:hypothetical protein
MKTYGGVDVQINVSLTSALVSRPGRFTSGERALSAHWIGGWVGPRAGLNDIEEKKFLTYWDSNFDTSIIQRQPVAIPTALSWLQ